MATTPPSVQSSVAAPASGVYRRWLAPWASGGKSRSLIPNLLAFACALLVLGVLAALQHEADGYYVYEPGSAPSITDSALCRAGSDGSLSLPGGHACVRVIVPSGLSHGLDGSIMMVDVLVEKADLFQYVESKIGLLSKGTQLIPDSEVPADATSGCASSQEMTNADQTAALLALRQLGYKVPTKDLGAYVDEVLPGTAAEAAGIMCNDVITAVNGVAISNGNELGSEILRYKPGDSIGVTIEREGNGDLNQTLHITARLGSHVVTGSNHETKTEPFLGVATETAVGYDFPIQLSVDVGDIGGPSAGLALTLAMIDLLGGGHLTGGHAVAVTGEVAANGAVLEIGGVPQKTVAVHKAGAQVFLVPAAQAAQARQWAGNMKVVGVSSVGQAVAYLETLGGRISGAG